ncbi:MAG: serine-type D-Ala-D-Ala carboxypeptidase [Gammaproteobacteria bacterium HGW-Gammaproteobacteria-3]|nr:MAG: serine-type D-Ala-D-Ala carboxypeptidase [Gammaproteobacteria bacterium HGW-Gammaproteobacteria-3]
MTLSKTYSELFIVCMIGLLISTWQCAIAAEAILIPAAPVIAAKSFILQDAYSGKVLAEAAADEKLAPASLTKIMSVYVVLNELSKGHLSLEEPVTISRKAWQTPGSRMFVEVNTQVKIEDLLKGVIIQSGNDASVALAEHIAGSEATFAEMMNQQAALLGMLNTHFSNSMGLPADDHFTTARDLAILTRALIREYPDYYRWFSEKEFTFNKITQRNRNKLLWRDDSVDGVKTGHTEAAGYCLVASAVREDMRLISVVMGANSERSRANENQTLLNYGFRFYETHRLYKGHEALTETRIWNGEQKMLQLGLEEDLYVTIPRRHYDDLKAAISFDQKIMAPVKQGDAFGTVNVTLAGEPVTEEKLVALTTVNEGNILRKLVDAALLMVQ